MKRVLASNKRAEVHLLTGQFLSSTTSADMAPSRLSSVKAPFWLSELALKRFSLQKRAADRSAALEGLRNGTSVPRN